MHKAAQLCAWHISSGCLICKATTTVEFVVGVSAACRLQLGQQCKCQNVKTGHRSSYYKRNLLKAGLLPIQNPAGKAASQVWAPFKLIAVQLT